MASTILVNSLKAQSGTEVEVPTGFTLNIADTGALTVNDVAITVGSSNIARKTADYTVLEADVSGKSELVITCNASASNRTITLPAVATSGLSTCIITIVADADATSTYKLMVQDSASAEVWTGYQNGDFVRLIVSNSVWVVLDHKETYYSRRYLTSNQTVAASATTKLAATTAITDIGGLWNNSTTRIEVPSGMSGWLDVSMSMAADSSYYSGGPAFYLDGTSIYSYRHSAGDSEGSRQNSAGVSMRVPVTTAQYFEFYIWNFQSNATKLSVGGGAGPSFSGATQFNATFTRTY
jgi:hypothetical protein